MLNLARHKYGVVDQQSFSIGEISLPENISYLQLIVKHQFLLRIVVWSDLAKKFAPYAINEK